MGIDLNRVYIVLMGVGGVGSDLVRQIVREKEKLANRYGLLLEVSCLLDSRSFLGDLKRPLTEQELIGAVQCKSEGSSLSDCGGRSMDGLEGVVREYSEPGTILVDCTATENTVPALLKVLSAGGSIVLANKKPLTCDIKTYRTLTSDPTRSRWETTVGSCLPVVTTLGRLTGCGDQVERMAGTLSGTLGFMMSGLEQGDRFGELVKEAHRTGSTEPDPRDDLSGMDVARKALILARGIGLELELTQVQVEGLIPTGLNEGSVEAFLENVGQLDVEFAAKVNEVRSRKRVLRYLATVENGECRVGLTEVPVESPIGRLSGNDNLLEIHSRLFSPQPLVIQGRGAGVEATAAGVLSDILELALIEASG